MALGWVSSRWVALIEAGGIEVGGLEVHVGGPKACGLEVDGLKASGLDLRRAALRTWPAAFCNNFELEVQLLHTVIIP